MIRKLQHSHIEDVVSIHLQCFPGSNSSLLGPNFLRSYYGGAVESENTIAMVLLNDKNVVGFIFGGVNKKIHSREIVRRSLFKFALALLRSLLKAPIRSLKNVSSYIIHYLSPLKIDPYYQKETSTLDSIALLEEFRGKGMADILLREFLLELKSRGIKQCRLGVLSSNKAARTFYEKHNFKQQNEEGSLYLLKL